MARPLRLELALPGAGLSWLDTLEQVCERFNWVCHAYCLMGNHYHLVVETPEANLSKGMRHLNGVYTQLFNRSHQRVGHVFQGRFKAILVEKESYLLELARYVVLNPLRARMVRQLENWPWSSYLATCGQAPEPDWLQCDFILSLFSARRSLAVAKYVAFVHEGKGLPSVWDKLKGQIYLGSEQFIEQMQALLDQQPTLGEIPRAQRRVLTQPLSEFARKHERNDAIALAYLSGQHTMAAIADHFGVHYTTVSRFVKAYEAAKKGV